MTVALLNLNCLAKVAFQVQENSLWTEYETLLLNTLLARIANQEREKINRSAKSRGHFFTRVHIPSECTSPDNTHESIAFQEHFWTVKHKSYGNICTTNEERTRRERIQKELLREVQSFVTLHDIFRIGTNYSH